MIPRDTSGCSGLLERGHVDLRTWSRDPRGSRIMATAMQYLLWRVTASVPFDWKWSKNRMWTHIGVGGKRKLAEHARARRDSLALLLRAELRREEYRVANNKLLFGIHVAMPNHRGDALNCIDLVADAIEDATGLNDRWFEMDSLTWSIDRANPSLEVWIGQTSAVDLQACGGACGELLTLEHFGKGSNRLGKTTVCRACQAIQRRRNKAKAKIPRIAPVPESEPDPRKSAPWLA